ncbi:hypothetical protein PBI_CLUBL_96 [Gordonia phage ClubL]|uniref:Uncharacterized protein n=1 Tax=Gordonia phage ClubL TaxID=1838065 RepID=A0A160DHU4_9CAUD|nr:hypothetical protein BH768_gp111 [Gordonia phage ClubL]ANA86594.1 hypothetical protein PBI_CLUBL_96 [Gordonia phage ClubL]
MKDNYDRSLDQAREQVHRLNTFLNTLPVRTAGGHFEDVRKYERILEGLTEILDAKRYENVVDAVRDLIERNDTQRELIEVLNGKANLSDHWKMQYDIARQKQLEAEQRAGMAEACCGCDNGGHHVLPKPDPKNPLHWSFASGLIRGSDLPGMWNWQDIYSHAQGLAREQAGGEEGKSEPAVTVAQDENVGPNQRLPEPNSTNPEHLRFAGHIVAATAHPNYNNGYGHQQPRTAVELFNEADRIVSKQAMDDAIEKAVTAYFDAAHNGRPKNVYPHVKSGMEAALNAAAAEWAEVNK